MRQITEKWHTQHMAGSSDKSWKVWHLRDRTTGDEFRAVIHERPCAQCMALVAGGLWPDYVIRTQNDENLASPTVHPI